jgi:3'-phosphoadenosine 5'-phosphosulfate sulfotransferase (PAPS reductase)/FAD synthetase
MSAEDAMIQRARKAAMPLDAPALFDEADAYDGDPTQPDLEAPTPVRLIATLTRPDRELRVVRLVQQAHDIYNDALAVHLEGHSLVASCLLFSGGNDSTTLGHLFKDRVSHVIHANTTIGIQETRQFVRDTCAHWGLPLLEKTPRKGTQYRDLVLGKVMARSRETGEMVQAFAAGFPGPAAHYIYYQRLKEKCLEQARRELVLDPRKERILFVAGRRRQESARRSAVFNGKAAVPLNERRGSTIWASPLCMWTSLDMNTYRLMHPDVPRNVVNDTLHMSGECLCGSMAHPGELDEIGYWFPEMKAEIKALEVEVKAAGVLPPYDKWGHGQGKPSEAGPMCSSCDARFIPGQTDLLDALGGAA